MRTLPAALVVLASSFLASGCTNGEKEPDDGAKPTIQTPKDLREQQKRVLQLLEVFEKHDLAAMDQAADELEEMSKSETHVVSGEIQEQVRKYRVRSSANDAIDRLRWLSRFARALLLLEGDDAANWARCRDLMVKSGPEAVVRFTGVLIIKFTDNPKFCRPMLMDLCVSHKSLVEDAILEALAFEGTEQPGAMKMRLLDNTAKKGLVSTLMFLPEPPVARLRESALRGPDTTRRAWAQMLASRKTRDRNTGVETTDAWATAILCDQIANDRLWEVRSDAAASLGETNDPAAALPFLTKALKDRDHWVRRNTCLSIGRFGGRGTPATGEMIAMLRGLDTEMFDVEVDGKTERRPLAGNPRRELDTAGLAALRAISGKSFAELETFFLWWDEREK
ncbi:MAG: HEAT repeat domain-containing protein [Planctomycetia bacterium]|nr:HEAT repeat domain-containing protein [Planctomycetia bacterium]